MLASDVIDRARIILQDGNAVRWLDPEMLQWLNDGQRTIVLVRPDACVTNAPLALVAGTRQKLPADALRLLDVIRNIATAEKNSGRAIRLVDREVLDTQEPNWHTQKVALVIRNYAYDNRDPLTFYVSPPAQGPDQLGKNGAKVEVLYSKAPDVITAVTDTLTLPDIYIDPLLSYLLFRCYTKEAQFAMNAQLAAGYLQACMNMLNVKTQRDVAFSPDFTSKGAMPNAASAQTGGVG